MVASLVFATIAAVLPGFLVGALAVQVGDEFDVDEGTYGWGIGAFFLAATLGSMAVGRLAQITGPRRQIIGVLLFTAVVQIVMVRAESFGALVAGLALCGVANAATQTAVNLALTEAQLSRLGLGIAVKQSSMPAAAMLSGLAVPVLALTVGWRAAYVASAGLAIIAMLAVFVVLPGENGLRRPAATSRPATERRVLGGVAVSSSLLAFSAGALAAWIVSSGVDAGLDEGRAGLMLGAGAACGIVMRLLWGVRLDGMAWSPLQVGGALSVVGSLGYLLLVVREPGWHIAATLIAYGAGWVWPVFTNFGVVRANQAAAAAATGITQTGVYVGVFSAPLVTGWLIETRGYGTMWAVVASASLVGAAMAIRFASAFSS